MTLEIAALGLAGVALWYAVKGMVRTLRPELAVTAGALGCLVVAATALGLALWARQADPGAVMDAAGDVGAWLAERLGVDQWGQRARAWARQQWTDLLDRVQQAVGLG